MRLPPHLPPRPFLGSIVVRSALAWMFVRFAAAFAMALAGVSDTGSPVIAAPVVLFALLAVLGDLTRRNEVGFLRNLGVGRADLALLVLMVLIPLELSLALLRSS